MIDKLDTTFRLLQFLKDEHLMEILAGQSIWCGDENEVKGRTGYLIT
jgi:hypothetical protein